MIRSHPLSIFAPIIYAVIGIALAVAGIITFAVYTIRENRCLRRSPCPAESATDVGVEP